MMKVIKRLFLYLISVLVIISLGWITFYASGTILQAKNMFADQTLYGMIIPGALFLILLMAGIAAACKNWKERYIKAAIVIVSCMILLVQIVYLSIIRIYISYDSLLLLDEAVKMIGAQTVNPDLYDTNVLVWVLYGVLKAAKAVGLYDLHWIPCLIGMICIDTAVFLGAKIVWNVKGSRICFLFLVLCLFNPILYLWIPWFYTAVCGLPFLMAGIYFLIKIGRSEKTSAKIGSFFLTVTMVICCTVILASDSDILCENGWMPDFLVEIEQEDLTDSETIFYKTADKAAVMWQDGSDGFTQDWLVQKEYSRSYLYICGEKNDIFLAYVQMYYAAILLLALWGTISSMIRNKGGTWLFLKIWLLINLAVWILWDIPNGYTVGLTVLFMLLAADGLEWIEVQRDTLSQKKTFRGKWILYGCCSLAMLVLTEVVMVGTVMHQEIHWRDYAVCNAFSKGTALKGLTSDDMVIQTFQVSSPFDSIYIEGYFSNPDEAVGGCRIELLDSQKQVLESREMTAEEIIAEQLYMKCDIISPVEESTYAIRITPLNVPEENALYLQRFEGALDLYPQGNLKQNHEYQNGDLVFRVYKDN